jgi:Spondin_N
MKKPFNRIFIPAILVLLVSCRKENAVTGNNYSEATYSVEVTGKWALPDFSIPANVHFTNFTGMVHNAQAELWKPGIMATKGVENVAEIGSVGVILNEIDSIISNKKALSLIFFTPPPPDGTKKTSLFCNSNYSRVSFVSMIAPSPDWFIGLSGIDLNPNNQWIADTTIQLYVYDAGTEDGDIFGYNNPETAPQQPIKLLEAAKATVLANGNQSLKPIASVRFLKL